jgi:hypothetical protein
VIHNCCWTKQKRRGTSKWQRRGINIKTAKKTSEERVGENDERKSCYSKLVWEVGKSCHGGVEKALRHHFTPAALLSP